ncbi:MAG: hypothetical protein U5K69_06190 [Balneolaceae bacterium]|nr:hypothetical protein [Balneolaceae bacterium]
MIAVLVSSCAQSISENINRGSEYMFRAGYPEVRMSAIGLFDEQGNAGINITANVVYGSLVYKEVKKTQTANVTIETRIVKTDSETNETVASESFDISVSENDQENITSSQDYFTFDKRYQVEPGNYEVYLTVVDQSSNRHTTRQTSTIIPSSQTERPVLTSIQLLGKDNETADRGYHPITTYDVRSKIDSLKFRFQVTNNDPEGSVIINSELVKFRS